MLALALLRVLANGEPALVAGSLFTRADDAKLAAAIRRADVSKTFLGSKTPFPMPPDG